MILHQLLDFLTEVISVAVAVETEISLCKRTRLAEIELNRILYAFRNVTGIISEVNICAASRELIRLCENLVNRIRVKRTVHTVHNNFYNVSFFILADPIRTCFMSNDVAEENEIAFRNRKIAYIAGNCLFLPL